MQDRPRDPCNDTAPEQRRYGAANPGSEGAASAQSPKEAGREPSAGAWRRGSGPPRIVVATRNPGKVDELRELLADAGIEVISLEEAGVGPDVELPEPGRSFAENAAAKALAAARLSGLPALADDSGLCVEALGGRPGVMSARYGGEGLSDAERNQLLLRELEGVPSHQRAAQFVCVIALAFPDGEVHLFEGRCRGLITEVPRGSGGFGYDPVFYYPPAGMTFAEMSREEKNRVSHRGRALARLKRELPRILAKRSGKQ